MVSNERKHEAKKAIGCVIAILCWSVSVALTRSIGEIQSVSSAVALPMLIGATVLAIYLSAIKCPLPSRLTKESVLRLVLFCGYQYTLVAAIAVATTREAAIAVSLGNYMWPALVLLLSFKTAKVRLSILLAPIAVGIVGTILAVCATIRGADFLSDLGAFAVAFVGALQWAIYTVLNKNSDTSGIWLTPAAMFLTSLPAIAYEGIAHGRIAIWNFNIISEMVILGVVPAIGFLMWDISTKGGLSARTASISMLAPVFSVLISSAYLTTPLGALFWLGAACVAASIAMCQLLSCHK